VFPLLPEKLVPAAAGVELRWANLNHDAIAALDAGEFEKAISMFESCRAAVPGEPVFTTNLAEALARLSLVEEEQGTAESRARSLAHLGRAAELAPGREDIEKRLAQVRRLSESERGFFTEPSEHFELSYDGARTDILWSSSDITRRLENAYQDFGELFGLWPVEGGRPRIRVVLYRKSGFHEATGMGHWAVGVFDGAVRVPVEDLGKEQATLERVLRHEVAHFFIRESGGTKVPGWLNEGLAQWLEPSFVVDRGRAVDAARRRLHGQTLLPLDSLQGPLGEHRTDAEVALAYTEALALCGWIESSFGERVLFDMVSASKTEEGWRAAFRLKTGTEIDSVLADIPK
jgi:tetratricopeptide (TPR) repeat protein